jgi:hypothetical protein
MNNLSQYSDEELMSIAGIPTGQPQSAFGKDAETFKRIAMAESSNNPRAINRNKNGTYDSGLYQINSIHIPELQKQGIIQKPSDLLDSNINTKAASYLYQRDGLRPWSSSKGKWDNGIQNLSDDELMRIAGISSEQPIQPQPEAPKKTGMFGQMKADLSKRAENIRNIERYANQGTTKERYINSPGYAIRTLGEIAGGVNDVVGPLIGEYISTASGYHNIPVEKREAIKNTIIQSKPVQAIGKGIKYAQENYPVASQITEDALNIGGLLPTGSVLSRGVGTTAGTLGRGIEKGVFNDIVKYVKKDVSKMGKEGTEAVIAGKVQGGGRFKQIELKTTPLDIETARVVSDVVNPNGNPYRNIDKIQDKISKRGYEIDNVVLNKDANSIHIGTGESDPLIPYFNKAKAQNDVVFGKDPTIQNSYDSVIDLFQQERAKQPNNLSGIYKARQNMDRILREKFGPDVLEKDAKDVARKTAMQDIHEQVANFISDTLPQGNRFKQLLKDEALMYRAKRHIALNNPPVVSKTVMGKIGNFIHQHPFAVFAGLGGTGFATGIITSPAVMGAIAAYGAYKVGKTVITNKMIRTEMAKILKGTEKVLTGSEKAEIKNVIKLMDDSERNIKGRKALPPGNPEKLYDATISIDKSGKARMGDYGRYVDEINSPYMAGTEQGNYPIRTSPFLPAVQEPRSVVVIPPKRRTSSEILRHIRTRTLGNIADRGLPRGISLYQEGSYPLRSPKTKSSKIIVKGKKSIYDYK